MRIGYVSDERYLALPGVWVEVHHAQGIATTQTSAGGAIDVDAPPGPCTVLLNLAGYGAKRVQMEMGAGEPYQFRLLRDALLGYMWPKWTRSGESAEFRVHSPSAYKLELWRYGQSKTLVRNLGWYDDHGPRATIQTTPDGDYTQSGIQWNKVGYGSQWHQQQVIAPERSGLYYLHAKNLQGDFFSFPWIVQPATPSAPIAVLASTITWNAYNNFGGRSNYVNQAGLPPAPTLAARQDLFRFTNPGTWPFAVSGAPLSFDRPELFNVVPEHAQITDPVDGRLESAMAPAEWRLLGWLEKEGFAYDLYSETELHFGRIDLAKYKVLILNTHPEYWSVEMYRQVKAWVYERGGKVLYLAGCGLYAEVEFDDEQTMRCRQEGRTDLRGESEAKLLGIAYTHSGYQSGAPYRVLNSEHWVFAGTGLRNGDLFGKRSLHERCPGGASAHELDKIGADSPPNIQHLARGDNDGGQGADMTLYETESGGAVFAVGSLAWTLAIQVDEQVSRITANVLRRFCNESS
jgi:hypothetical protein